MVFSSPIFGQVTPFAGQYYQQNPQAHQLRQQAIAQAYQTLNVVEQIAIQQVQYPQPHLLHQQVYIVEQQKQLTQAAIQQLVQYKLQTINQVATPIHRQQVEQSVQRFVQLAQIKQQIRQLLNDAKNTPNPQKIHDNAKQVVELTQLAKLVLAQIQQNQYNQINFGTWAQQGLFNINPFGANFNTYGHHGLFGWNTVVPTVYPTVYGQSPIFGQYTPFY